ncbi:hypothetical protein C1H46_031797 [Malus baccata]|uniref:BTB domain-containing protein n=1 Tax=Malus baccata TaxID=106549 RepID=A0A540L8H3_MALBA|nr:hypothetical protein C1H46_031797 [Malus baccata]
MSGLLTGGRIMTMRVAVILYHLSKNDAEQRKLDVAFIGAKYMLKLENGCSVSVANDLIIQVGDSNFYLHKLPMVIRRGYLNRLVFQRINVGRDASPRIHLDNLPHGAKVFESVVKFCYGWKFDLINIAPLYCAAHFLEMSDDFKQGNLISKTETFLSFLIFPSWKDTFRILRSCESISLCAKELKISKRSTEGIAWKACPNGARKPLLGRLVQTEHGSCVVLDRDYCKGIRDKGGGSKFRYMVTQNIHFSCMNASGDSIECSQDGIFGVVLLVAYSTCIVVGGEFYSSNIELGRAGKPLLGRLVQTLMHVVLKLMKYNASMFCQTMQRTRGFKVQLTFGGLKMSRSFE